MNYLKLAPVAGICLILSPFIIFEYRDWRDIKKIESIEWDITVGGNGTYSSKDGQYRLYVSHPYPPSLGSKGDDDGCVIFYYMGGSNYIEHFPAESMKTFNKR